ncbi:MAG TPA: hypothetical protein VK524_14275 [Polyangiaceae bacterium]|nr:hypothetical protein [Polyangiaceae bacterium]
MSEPDSGDDLEQISRRLFEAARSDGPDLQARRRARQALGIGVASTAVLATTKAAGAASAEIGAAGSSAAGSVWSGTLGMFAKVAAVGVTGAAVWIAVDQARTPDEPISVTAEPARHETRARPPTPKVVTTVPVAPPASAHALPTASAPEHVRAPGPKRSEPKTPARRAQPAPSASEKTDTLSPEIAVLDEARKQLLNGDSAHALQQLETYRTRFATGRLTSEATVLRVEALARSGQRESAERLGRSFIAANPNDPLVDRVRAILKQHAPASESDGSRASE